MSGHPDTVAPSCMHCDGRSRLVTGRIVYPNRPDLTDKLIWLCQCGARVGCHPGGTRALGRPANEDLRKARMAVHAKLDPIWKHAYDHPAYKPKTKKDRTSICAHARSRVYRYLAHHLGLAEAECHTGLFDLERCAAARAVLTGLQYDTVRTWDRARVAESTSRRARA